MKRYKLTGALAMAVLGGCGGSTPGADAAGTDAAADAARLDTPDDARSDASADAAACTPPSADWVESDEAGNAMAPEATGLALDDEGAVTIGGCLAAGDTDRYSIIVGSTSWLSAVTTAGTGALVTLSQDAGDITVSNASGALQPIPGPPPGRYTLEVREAGGGPVAYVVRVDSPHCGPGIMRMYYESRDGSGRGNDVLSRAPAAFAFTADETDAPEPSDVVLAPGDSLLVGGESAMLGSDGDDYRDRDTFLLSAGTRVRRLLVAVTASSVPGEMPDVRSALLPADSLDPVGLGDNPSSYQRFGAVVAPGQDLWLWVARRDDSPLMLSPASYNVTICATD